MSLELVSSPTEEKLAKRIERAETDKSRAESILQDKRLGLHKMQISGVKYSVAQLTDAERDFAQAEAVLDKASTRGQLLIALQEAVAPISDSETRDSVTLHMLDSIDNHLGR